MKRLTLLACTVFTISCSAFGQGASPRGRAVFVPVKPVTGKQTAATTAANLRIGTAKFFPYAMPEGWRVGEDGQFALTLVAADNKAFTVMVGNAGLPPSYQPARFVY